MAEYSQNASDKLFSMEAEIRAYIDALKRWGDCCIQLSDIDFVEIILYLCYYQRFGARPGACQ